MATTHWGELPSTDTLLDIERGVSDVLPRFRVHRRVLRSIRNRIGAEDDAALLGTIAAREIVTDDPQIPRTIYADTLLPISASSLGLSLTCGARTLIPVVKCQAVPVQRTMRTGALRWRRLNEKSNAGDDSLQLLRGAVALASLSGQTLTLVLAYEAPKFSLWTAHAIEPPLVVDSPLALALAASTPLRHGETIGLLVHPESDPRMVAPIRDSATESKAVGVWILGDQGAARIAAAAYILRAAERRNTRLRRGTKKEGNVQDDELNRDVSFLLAHYSETRGGEPMIYRCTTRVSQGKETYVATVGETEGDDDVETLAVDFQTITEIAAEDREQLGGSEGGNEAKGSLGHLVQRVAALRVAMESQGNTNADEADDTEDVPERRVERVEQRELQRDPQLTPTSGDAAGSSSIVNRTGPIDLSNLPRSIRVDLDTGQPTGQPTRIDDKASNEDHNWRRIEALAKKYNIPTTKR